METIVLANVTKIVSFFLFQRFALHTYVYSQTQKSRHMFSAASFTHVIYSNTDICFLTKIGLDQL